MTSNKKKRPTKVGATATAVCALMLATTFSASSAFAPPPAIGGGRLPALLPAAAERRAPSSSRSNDLIVLGAKNKPKSGGGGSGSGGGGFGGGGGGTTTSTTTGASSSASSSSAKKKAKKPTNGGKACPSKVRTVTGHTGSGTKVLAAAANTFDAIRKDYGKDSTSDVYVRSPLDDARTFWFVGKVNRRTDPNDSSLVGSVAPTENDAVLSQKRLLLEYSKNQLRPQNLGGPRSPALEVWTAPGDSEMDAVRNMVDLVKVVGSTRRLSDGFSVKDVGYNPEIYVGDEREKGGLRIQRDEEGKPVKPAFDINDGT